jgi:hypothetical protein
MPKKIFDILPPEEKKILIEKEKKAKLPLLKLGFILLIFLSLSLSSFYFSRAKIEIWPEIRNLNFKTEIKNISGQFFEEETESPMEFPSTGIIEKKEFAKGKLRVYNNSKTSRSLVQGTHFLSDKGKQFHTLKGITIPAKGYLDNVEVEADAPGPEYNIGPSKFSVPRLAGTSLYTLIYAESFELMKGGFIGKVPQVTEEDLKNAERILLEKLSELAKESLKKNVPEGYIFLEELLKQEVLEKFPLTKAGQELKSFIFKAKIKSKAFIFKKADLENFAKEFVYSKITTGPGLNQKLIEGSLNLNYSVKEKDMDKGKLTLSLEISAQSYSQPDFPLLKDRVKGKSVIEAEYLLEKEEEISKVKIKVFPFWVKTLPKNVQRIEIELKI